MWLCVLVLSSLVVVVVARLPVCLMTARPISLAKSSLPRNSRGSFSTGSPCSGAACLRPIPGQDVPYIYIYIYIHTYVYIIYIRNIIYIYIYIHIIYIYICVPLATCQKPPGAYPLGVPPLWQRLPPWARCSPARVSTKKRNAKKCKAPTYSKALGCLMIMLEPKFWKLGNSMVQWPDQTLEKGSPLAASKTMPTYRN